MVHCSCHWACLSLRNISLAQCLPHILSINPNLLVCASLLGAPEPIPGIGGGNNIDSRQGFRLRGLGRGRGWAMEVGLQLGNPQVLLPKLLCCCPQRGEAVTWLAWSQEAGVGAENRSIARSVSRRPIMSPHLASAGIAFYTSGGGELTASSSIPSPALINPICHHFHYLPPSFLPVGSHFGFWSPKEEV